MKWILVFLISVDANYSFPAFKSSNTQAECIQLRDVAFEAAEADGVADKLRGSCTEYDPSKESEEDAALRVTLQMLITGK